MKRGDCVTLKGFTQQPIKGGFMEKLLEKLEAMATKVMDSVNEKPIKTVFISLLVIWLVGKIIHSLRGIK
jgi:hypothetical protein